MTDLEKTVRRWLKLRVQIAELEAKRDDLRPAIEEALLKAKDNTKTVCGTILSFKEEFSRRFNEKRAREALGDNEVDSFFDSSPKRVLRAKK